MKVAGVVVAVAAALLGVASGRAQGAASISLLIGSGPVAGFAFPLGGELCRLIEQSGSGAPHCAVVTTDGSVENIARLRSGELQLAIVQSDLATEAVAGSGPFKSAGPFSELRSIAGFYGDDLTLLVKANGPIHELDDIKGKRVAVGEPGANDPLFGDLLEGLGWSKADLNGVMEMPRADQIAALCAGKVDAVAVTAPHPNGFIRDLIAACPVLPLDLGGAGADAAIAAHRAYAPARVAFGIYSGKEQTVRSFGPRAVLVTSASMPDDVAERILTVLLSHLEVLKKSHPAFAGLDQSIVVSAAGLGAERHRAVAKYLTDKKLLGQPLEE